VPQLLEETPSATCMITIMDNISLPWVSETRPRGGQWSRVYSWSIKLSGPTFIL